MMKINSAAQQQIQSLRGFEELQAFGRLLHAALMEELQAGEQFSSSRARAVLQAVNMLDDPTWHAYLRLVDSPEKEATLRVALYDLIDSTEMGDIQLEGVRPTEPTEIEALPWLPLIVAAFAYKSGYPVGQLDPSSPPAVHSPAGLMLQAAAHFVRRQPQRSATERERLARQLMFNPTAVGEAPASLDSLSGEPQPPVPPHYRPPVPVRYPEYNPEVQIENTDVHSSESAPSAESVPADVTRGDPLTITESDLSPPQPQPRRMPEITITHEQTRTPQVNVGPAQQVPREVRPSAASNFANSLRSLFSSEQLKSTKLYVTVQEYPDGPGLFGLQVRVTCKGVKSYVAGTTDREGRFVCELPVRLHSGLTYDVDVTWPREHGGEVERKSMTLNADRTRFSLPFYRRLNP